MDRENRMVGLWLAFLLVVGCWTFRGLIEAGHRAQCIARGQCVPYAVLQPSPVRQHAAVQTSSLGAYLRDSRPW